MSLKTLIVGYFVLGWLIGISVLWGGRHERSKDVDKLMAEGKKVTSTAVIAASFVTIAMTPLILFGSILGTIVKAVRHGFKN